MPGLQSFCVSTALGLAAIYLLQVQDFFRSVSVSLSLCESCDAGGCDDGIGNGGNAS